MPSPIYRRPRPLGVTIGGGSIFTFGTGTQVSGRWRYNNFPLLFPGVWQVEVVGGGGGGGGYDTFYARNGEAGARASYAKNTITILSSPTVELGFGGNAGADSSSGGGVGSSGFTSSVAGIGAGAGSGGRGGVQNSNYNRIPQTSLWPYGPAGTGGYGRAGGSATGAYSGDALLKLVG